jgi:CRISPR-associated protein Cas2
MLARRSLYVCYDIAHPKRLRRVAESTEDSGLRVQKSVFECSLNADEWLALRARLGALVNGDEDRLMYQPVCDNCRRRIAWQGLQPSPEHQPYWVV